MGLPGASEEEVLRTSEMMSERLKDDYYVIVYECEIENGFEFKIVSECQTETGPLAMATN